MDFKTPKYQHFWSSEFWLHFKKQWWKKTKFNFKTEKSLHLCLQNNIAFPFRLIKEDLVVMLVNIQDIDVATNQECHNLYQSSYKRFKQYKSSFQATTSFVKMRWFIRFFIAHVNSKNHNQFDRSKPCVPMCTRDVKELVEFF